MSQLALQYDPCARKHGGNLNSTTAHGRIVPRKNRLQMAVLDLLGCRPMTAKEMAVMLDEPLHCLSGRCSELLAAGRIERTGERRDGGAVLSRGSR